MPQHHRSFSFRALATILIGLARGSSAFISPKQQRCVNRILGSSNNDDIFFDDFGDGFSDGSSSNSNNNGNNSNNLSSLQSRMSQVKGAEAAYDSKIARNWRRGNWSVRGFALESSSYTTASPTQTSATDTSKNDVPVHISAVVAPTSSYPDISVPQDKALPQDRTVAVGRTDGSVFIVKLGEQYLTSFVAAPMLVVEQDDNGDEAGMSVRVQNEWMDSNELKDTLHGERPQTLESGMGEEGDGQMAQDQSPFEISYQFLASEHSLPIKKLAFHDIVEGDDCECVICTAAGSSGDISLWKLPASSEDINKEPMQTVLLGGVHNDEIVSLETMVLQEQNVLFSASRDGLFALWNLDRNGELMLSCQCTDVENGSTMSLTCGDVSNPSSWDDDHSNENDNDNDAIFLGTSSGCVVGYVVRELLSLAAAESSADVESACPTPNLRFRAHGPDSGLGEAVSAIKCGGDGTIPTSARLRGGDESKASSGMGRNPRMSSSILLTGGEDGSVKQW